MTEDALPQPPSTFETASGAESLEFSYVPRPGLMQLMFVNLLLKIITLGVYHFWAKTNVRKHIWSCVHINGEPLEYTGTGWEKFAGFLMVFAMIVLPVILLSAGLGLYLGPQSPVLGLIQIGVGLFVYVFWGFAIYRSINYMLSRTNWRGIRGALVGSAMIYSLLYFGSILARGMSMGWATPVMNTVLQEQLINDMRFGDAAFKFKGRAGPLYPTYALCWFLTLAMFIAAIAFVTGYAASLGNLKDFFGHLENPENTKKFAVTILFLIIVFVLVSLLVAPMLWSIYIAKEMRTFATYSRFDGAQFSLRASAMGVIGLTVVNLLMLLITLGIAKPFVNQRILKFYVDRLSLEGKIDVDRIRQSQAKMLKRGEGFLEAFDIGGVFGGI